MEQSVKLCLLIYLLTTFEYFSGCVDPVKLRMKKGNDPLTGSQVMKGVGQQLHRSSHGDLKFLTLPPQYHTHPVSVGEKEGGCAEMQRSCPPVVPVCNLIKRT